jgi:hypothetical protein
MNTQRTTKEVSVENPDQHWEYVNVKNKRVLDLGCGDFLIGNKTYDNLDITYYGYDALKK